MEIAGSRERGAVDLDFEGVYWGTQGKFHIEDPGQFHFAAAPSSWISQIGKVGIVFERDSPRSRRMIELFVQVNATCRVNKCLGLGGKPANASTSGARNTTPDHVDLSQSSGTLIVGRRQCSSGQDLTPTRIACGVGWVFLEDDSRDVFRFRRTCQITDALYFDPDSSHNCLSIPTEWLFATSEVLLLREMEFEGEFA